MLHLLCPDECLRTVYDIDLDRLWAMGIRGLILDLDNTLVAWEQAGVSQEIRTWIHRLQAKGFRVCIASNGVKSRVRFVADGLGIPSVTKGVKPRKRPFKLALELLDLPPQAVAVVGDQLFTDILGGNRMDLHTILINPLSKRELRTTRIVRRVERRVIARLHKKGLLSARDIRVRQG